MQVRTPLRSKKQTKIHPRTLQNQAKIGPTSLPRASQKPSGGRVSPKSSRKSSKRGLKRLKGAHNEVPGSTKAAQRAPKGGQRARQRDLGRGKIDPKLASAARRAKFPKSAPRLGPADVSGTSPSPDRPRIGQKSSQVGPSSPSSGLLDRVWPFEGASSGLGARLGSTRAALGAPRGRLLCAPLRAHPNALSLIRIGI